MRGDLIRLTGVRARGHHGVLGHERRDGQDFVVDVVLGLDLAPAAATDDLADTVSYAEVAADVVEVVEGPPRDLIETVAGQIADRALARPRVEWVEVTVHKPQAPVGVPFADVAVVLHRRRDVPVVIAFGANLDGADGTPPARALRSAVGRLRRVRGVHAVRPSRSFVTAPVGGDAVAGQPDYVNAVVLARTSLAPAALLAALHRVEADLGRTRQVRWGARTMDLDLVQYGRPGEADEVVSGDPDLTLPHPRAHERAFVLVPWADVDPEASLRRATDVVPVRELLGTELLLGQDVHPLEGEP